MSRNHKIYAASGVLLLLALGLFISRERDPASGRGELSAGPGSAGKHGSSTPDAAPTRTKDRKRAPAQKDWSAAKEVPPSNEVTGNQDSPLFLSFLKSDAARTTLRVGFRQEKQEEIAPEDYQVSVELLDSEGRNFGPENTTSAMWWTAQEDFGNEGAPMLEVKSANPVAAVELKLSYKGKEVERRKYEVAER